MRKLGLLVALLALLIMTAIPALGQDSDSGHVRVAHFANGVGAVDVYVNGEVAVQEIRFGVLSEWAELPAGTYDLAVVPTGGALDEAVIEAADFELAGGEWFTVAAIGVAGDPNFPLIAQPIAENYGEIGLGEARVTIFHAIPNAGPIDVLVVDGPELVGGLTYPGQAETLGISSEPAANDGVAVLPDLLEGTYDLVVTALNEPETVLFDLPATELEDGNSYLIAAIGLAGEGEIVVSVTNVADVNADVTSNVSASQDLTGETCDGEGTVNVRVAHFASLGDEGGENAVDVYLNGALTDVQGLPFGQATEFIELPAGSYDVDIVPAGDDLDSALLNVTGVGLCADQYITLAAIGLAETNSLMIQPIVEDFSPLGLDTARITVFHAIPAAAPVNVQLADGTLLVGNLTYPGQAASLGISDEPAANDGVAIRTVDSGIYDIEVTLADDPETVVLSFEDVELTGGRNYFIAAIGLPSSPDFALFSTLVPGE